MDTTQIPTIVSLVEDLARVRFRKADAQDELNKLTAEFNARPDVVHLKALIKDMTDGANTLTDVIREDGLTQSHPALKIRNKVVVTINETLALEWCRKNMPVAIIESVNEKMVEEYAKKNPTYWATVETVPQVTIATDLSEWLPK